MLTAAIPGWPTDFAPVLDASPPGDFPGRVRQLEQQMSAMVDQNRALLHALQDAFDMLNRDGALQIRNAFIEATNGIAFPAIQLASTDVNTLDDYEEGTWTPGITFTTPGDLAITLNPTVGDYTKIGRLVIATFRCNSTAFTFTTASGNMTITGLPFAASSDANFSWPGPCTWGGITKAGYTSVAAEITPGVQIGTLTASGSGVAPSIVTAADTPSGGTLRLRGAFIYRI